jgi:hemoglobin
MNSDQRDIDSRADIERLVNDFYERVRGDELLRPIFDDVAQTDWARHLPKMYDFWEGVLFGVAGFRGNPLAVHRELACRVPLREREFGRWLDLFHESVDTLFCGPCAEDAKTRALRIAAVMQHHISRDLASRTAVLAGDA